MPRALLGLFIVALLVGIVWLSGRGPRPDAPTPAAPWGKVHDGGKFVVHRSNTTPAAYLIAVGNNGLLIDCPDGLPEPPAAVRRVLLTHHHRDGCDGVPRFGAAVTSAPKASVEWLRPANVAKFWAESIPLRNSRTGYFVHPTGLDVACDLTDGQILDFEGVKIEVVATPGHSPDHVAFAVNDVLFLGDAMTGDGKSWTPFTTDWDHWQDVGLKPTAASLRKLAARNPAKLLPARGPVVSVNPKARLEAAAKKVDEAGFLKSFTRFTDRLGNPPKYDYLVPDKQPMSNGSRPWAKVSNSLWITGNTYVLKSNRSNGLMVIDPWGTRGVEQIEKLRIAEKLGPVELVAFSHAHYDHFDGVYTLPVKGAYKVWALDAVAEPLEAPFRYRAPFLDERPIAFDRTFKDGETGTWQEYQFKFHHFPGQSYFTAAMECDIDGKRCLFTADNFFHQAMYSGSGGWMGLNRSSPALYARSAKTVLKLNPEWILAEHGGPFVFNAEDFRRRVAWGEAGAKACDALCVSGDHRLDWSPHTIQVSPILLKAKPGAEVRCEVRVIGRPEKADVVLRTSWSYTVSDPDVDWRPMPKYHYAAKFKYTNWSAVVTLRVPKDAKPGRVVIPVTIRRDLGEVADPFLAVDVME